MGAPKLREMATVLGKEVAVLTIESLLLEYIMFAGADWTKFQINVVVKIIEDNYAHWTYAHWKLFFEKAKVGDFGKTFGKISTTVFNLWLRDFSAEVEDANEQVDICLDRQRAAAPLEQTDDQQGAGKRTFSEVLEVLEQQIAEDKRRKKEILDQEREEFDRRLAETVRDNLIAQGIDPSTVPELQEYFKK